MIGISESWLCEDIYITELFDSRYNIVRKDRPSNQRGGGVVLALKKNIKFELIKVNSDIECVIVKAKYKKQDIFISVVYIPPLRDINVLETYLSLFESYLLDNKLALLIGDFNLPYLGQNNSEKNSVLQEFLLTYNLKQHNTVVNCLGRTLDLIISNTSILELCRSSHPLVIEDNYHPALEFGITVEKRNSEQNDHGRSKVYKYDFSKGNYLLLYELLSQCDWISVLREQSIDNSLDIFYEILYKCLDASIPKYASRAGLSSSCMYPMWYSSDLRNKINKKNKLHKLINCKNLPGEKQNEYKKLRTLIKHQTKNEYKLYQKNLEQNINIDPTSFWSFFRDRKNKGGIPEEMRLGEDLYNEVEEIANAFSKYFQSVYENSSNPHLPHDWGTFEFSHITENKVMDAIRKLKPKKSVGSDGVPAYIIKGCSEFLVRPLQHIFNLAVSNQTFPAKLKTTIITPIYKNGSVNNIDNYRPISLINAVAKVFERILFQDIFDNIEAEISRFQHGFIRDKSTVTNLCNFTEHAYEALEQGSQLDVIYTDCSKAFDKVDHGILLNKLITEYGFSREAYNLVRTYLLDRPQVIKISNFNTNAFTATSGVPQGSNLGPLLFIMFINSLPEVLQHSVGLLYADDFKIFKKVTCDQDCVELQMDVSAVEDWFSDNRMQLNTQKCSTVTYTRKIQFTQYLYQINGTSINRNTEVRDLGVDFSSNLKFNRHYENCTNKALKVLGYILRKGKFFSLDTISRLFDTLVRPHLEYASIVWMPAADCNKNLIEKVQKRFLRYLYVRTYNEYPILISYNRLLHMYNYTSLLHRRNCQAVIFVYYIINSIKYRNCDILHFIKLKVPKPNLRILNKDTFVTTNSKSPINLMLCECNKILGALNIDIFNISLSNLKEILGQTAA